MTATTKINHTERVAGFEAEIQDLESQLRAAKTSSLEASDRLIEIARGMDELSPSVLVGDEDSKLDLLALEEESAQYERQQRVARAALDAYQAELAQKKLELKAAKEAQAKDEHDALAEQLAAPEERAVNAAKELIEARGEHRRIHERMLDQARVFESADRVSSRGLFGPPDMLSRSIRRIWRNNGLA
jgi:hypothetical protein